MTDETSRLLEGNGQTPRYTPNIEATPVGETRANDDDSEGLKDSGRRSTLELTTIALSLTLGVFLVAMDSTIVASSNAAISSELKQLQNSAWIATGYMLTMSSFQPLYGKLSDIFGRKSCLLFAYCVFAVGCLFCGLARNMTQLVAARALAGVGGGGMTTVVSIIMSDIVPLRARGKWQGLLSIAFGSGQALGAPLGGFMVDSIGWRWAFLLQLPVIVLAVIAVSFTLKVPSTERSDFFAKLKRVDFAGAATLVVMIFALLFGLDRGGNVSWNDMLTVSALAGFVILFCLFGIVELKLASEPFVPKRIVANRALLASYMVNFFGGATIFTIIYHTSLYLQAVQNKSPSETGLWLLPGIGGGVFGSLAGGLLIQKTGKYYWLFVSSYTLLVIGTMLVTLYAGVLQFSLLGICIGLILTNVGTGAGMTTSLIASISNAGPTDQAIATAVSFLFRSLGCVVGLSLGSTLMHESLRKSLHRRLSGNVDEVVRHIVESLSYIYELDPATQSIVRGAYEDAIQVTMWFSVMMAACALISSLFIKEKILDAKPDTQ